MNYDEAIEWLFSTQLFGIKLGLEGPRALLKEYLAYPLKGVQVIHVAGTNGKGSTCAMMDSVARASGLRTGLFTSPHLIDYRERMKVSGQDIPEDRCAAGLTDLRRICEKLENHPTFFEITLALAMRWFRECECELIILETGMGGRLDATTAVPADVCVLTPIALDHTQWLGHTPEEIAYEKAGIFVEGKPIISSPQDASIRSVLEKEANEKRSEVEFTDQPLLGYAMALSGEHQTWNAAVAITALFRAGLHLNFDTIQYGLSKVSWPGRFEMFNRNGKIIVLDGAHNPHAAKVLADTWKLKFRDERPTLLFSAVSSKDISGILEHLAPLASRICICPVDTPRATPTEELAAALPPDAPPHHLFPDFDEAFSAAMNSDSPVLIAGSLFLVGEARAVLTEQAFQSCSQ
ncbi:bifunctional folylpolyglutamate synthase/dihydrofolate synthase [Luteolibacter pohnpeiensis]|uniref:Dihydrofolate synthase/folylpolyglutamate synthase n=1 Tax=Luteolibacter pohnpeiensis TaxID=454153 RepID=A0A934VWE3_9BACT|nr:folylpolyglutamate synthase/dihydrofolate synthase family protein [Luteolibacter pohnpeiensis]MBK1883190.1 bifunctional folylpolyglutamate synthase/dihydrofolate synthase [Luteolibacter pohnpeiensis]